MRILLLSFYFPPDLSACSFRMKALLEALEARLPDGAEIDLLTSLPNRYGSFSPDAPEEETIGRCNVRRIAVPSHSSGMVDQAKAYLSFVRQSISFLREQDYDVVFATSSRLMTASFGAAISRWKDARLYLDIRDIFVETMADLLAGSPLGAAVPTLGALERWTLESADRVNLVSGGFSDYFEDRYPHRRFSYISNGVDPEFVRETPRATHDSRIDGPLRVVYAGNLGEGQGLHHIVPALAARLGDRVSFDLYGDGGRRGELERELSERGLSNVRIIPPVERSGLMEAYEQADILFLHLNNHRAFERVLPSKIFEYAAMGKPIWAGVSGFAGRFLKEEVANAAVFPPGKVDQALRALESLEPGFVSRAGFSDRYGRANLSLQLADGILSLGAGSP